jgi:antitoxin ParD1/3/4
MKRLNVTIDDALLAAALRAGPYATPSAAVEAGLKQLVALRRCELLALRGALRWSEAPHSAGLVTAPGRAASPSRKANRRS